MVSVVGAVTYKSKEQTSDNRQVRRPSEVGSIIFEEISPIAVPYMLKFELRVNLG